MSETIVAYQSFIGVDLHKTTVTLVAVAPDGSTIAQLTINTKCREKIAAWLLALPRPSRLAVEAVGFVEWFIDRFRPRVDRIDIADATELANRRGKRRKRDPGDARDVALRLARGECPLGYIAAEIGPFERFPNADALEFWAGLTSDLKESAGRTQPGKITKAGSRTLRWALCNAAVTLCQSDAKQEAIRQRLIRKIGGIKGKANTAMGRRLLRVLYAMVRDGKPYQAGPSRKRNAAANKARAAKLARKNRKTGKEAA